MFKSIKKTMLIGILAISATVSPIALAGGKGWSHDYKASMAKAKKENKDMILDFTGSDWCGWCIRLNQEVFSKAEFKNVIPKSFVLVELDFPQKPQNKAKMTKATIAQNNKLKNQFRITGFPTIYLTDQHGKPYARTGYAAGGPKVYNKSLLALQQKRILRDKFLNQAKKAKGLAKAKLLDQAVTAVGEDLAWAYEDLISQIIKLDNKDKAGLKSKYQLKKQIRKINALAGNRETWDKAIKYCDQILSKKTTNKATRQELLFIKSKIVYYQKGDYLTILKAAYNADTKSKSAVFMKSLIKRFEAQKTQKNTEK